MKSVGIEIGSFSIKIAEIDATHKSYALVNFEEFPLNQAPGADHDIEVIETLRRLQGRYDATTTRFVFAISSDAISLKHKVFPFRERGKIIKSLPFELEDEVPLNQDDIVFDYRPICYRGKQAEVMAVIATKDDVRKRMTLAAESGIDPDIVTVECLALANVFENWASPPPVYPEPIATNLADDFDEKTRSDFGIRGPADPARLVLHLGHKRSTLLVLRDGRLLSSRTFLWGGVDIAEGLARTFSISQIEAVRALPTKTFILLSSEGATKDQRALSEAVTQAVDQIVTEIQITLVDLKSQYNLEFSQIDLTGGVSLTRNIGPYLTRRLELPANLVRHLDRMPNVTFPAGPEVDVRSGVVVGLAIEGLKRPFNPSVNLRQHILQKKNKSIERVWAKWETTAKLAGALFCVFLVYSMWKDSLALSLFETSESHLAAKAKAIGLDRARQRPSGVRRHIKTLNEKVRASEMLSALQGIPSAFEVFRRLNDSVPVSRQGYGKTAQPFYELKKVSVNFNQMQVEGVELQPGQAARIERALKSLAVGGKVQKAQPTISAKTANERPFAFSFQVERSR